MTLGNTARAPSCSGAMTRAFAAGPLGAVPSSGHTEEPTIGKKASAQPR
jgi:hypothetical protein